MAEGSRTAPLPFPISLGPISPPMYRLLRPLLFRLDAEDAHGWGDSRGSTRPTGGLGDAGSVPPRRRPAETDCLRPRIRVPRGTGGGFRQERRTGPVLGRAWVRIRRGRFGERAALERECASSSVSTRGGWRARQPDGPQQRRGQRRRRAAVFDLEAERVRRGDQRGEDAQPRHLRRRRHRGLSAVGARAGSPCRLPRDQRVVSQHGGGENLRDS